MSCDKDNNYACSSTISSSSAQYCCAIGDTCVGFSICYFTHRWKETSGYYVGGCTNATYPSPVCSEQCSDHHTGDIVYNSTTNLWACCYGLGVLDCSNPTDETIEAPSPEQLLASLGSLVPSSSRTLRVPYSTSPAVIFSATTSSTSTTPSIAATRILTISQPLNTIPPNDDKSSPSTPDTNPVLSSSEGIGVGVGVTILGIGLLALTVYFVRRSRNSRKSTVRSVTDTIPAPVNSFPPTGNPREELDAPHQQMELDSKTHVELDGCVSGGA